MRHSSKSAELLHKLVGSSWRLRPEKQLRVAHSLFLQQMMYMTPDDIMGPHLNQFEGKCLLPLTLVCQMKQGCSKATMIVNARFKNICITIHMQSLAIITWSGARNSEYLSPSDATIFRAA